MKVKDVMSFVNSELRAEREVSLNLSNHQFFAWKCRELDKLISELESVRSIESLKEVLSHIMFFNKNQLMLLN